LTTQIRFLGVAAFEITTSQGQVILIDPFIEDNPASPVKVSDLKRVDLVLVTHLAEDHLGDAAEVIKCHGCPVVCGPEVGVFLGQQGINPNLIRRVPWGGQVNPKGIRVRAVESRHTSFRRAPDGQYLSGQPLGFILYADPDVRIYHSGDTALFSDLKLIGQLYRPNIGLLCACELEKSYLQSIGLEDHQGNEMSGEEGAMAAVWLGLDYAIICHYLRPEGHEDVRTFMRTLENGFADGTSPIKPLALQAGEIFQYPMETYP
jgi:L-ascorbate metabolism protein UlaG (beta-lactamase superfamily)